jgi:hypothetical protein
MHIVKTPTNSSADYTLTVAVDGNLYGPEAMLPRRVHTAPVLGSNSEPWRAHAMRSAAEE